MVVGSVLGGRSWSRRGLIGASVGPMTWMKPRTAGPTITIRSRAGKMNRTMGKSSLTAIFSADSSARWLRRSRAWSSRRSCSASTMLAPKRSDCTSSATSEERSSAPVRSAMCRIATARGTPRLISRLVSSISSAKIGLTRADLVAPPSSRPGRGPCRPRRRSRAGRPRRAGAGGRSARRRSRRCPTARLGTKNSDRRAEQRVSRTRTASRRLRAGAAATPKSSDADAEEQRPSRPGRSRRPMRCGSRPRPAARAAAAGLALRDELAQARWTVRAARGADLAVGGDRRSASRDGARCAAARLAARRTSIRTRAAERGSPRRARERPGDRMERGSCGRALRPSGPPSCS